MGDPGAEPGIIFHVIAEAGNTVDVVDSFMKHLVEIFAHVKKEILEFCEELGLQILNAIRQKIFDELVTICFLENYDLVERRKVTSLAEDVYVMGFSLVNKRRHKRLIKLLKYQKEDLTEPEMEVVNPDSVELLTAYLDLKKVTGELNTQVLELRNKVLFLENEICSLKTRSTPGVAQDDEVLQPRKDIKTFDNMVKPIVVPDAVSGPKKQKVIADVHCDINGIKQKPVNSNINEIEAISSGPEESEGVFRHSERERKNILKKPRTSSRPMPDNRLKAASLKDSRKPHTHLVYVGRLAKDTSEGSLRSYLAEIGVLNGDIADILKLTSRLEYQSSFCISLNTTVAEKLVLDHGNWPNGVLVRTFRRQINAKRQHPEKPPRFHQSYRHPLDDDCYRYSQKSWDIMEMATFHHTSTIIDIRLE